MILHTTTHQTGDLGKGDSQGCVAKISPSCNSYPINLRDVKGCRLESPSVSGGILDGAMEVKDTVPVLRPFPDRLIYAAVPTP